MLFLTLGENKTIMGKAKEYTNGEVTIVWEANKCIHSAICVNGLGKVFKSNAKPWVKADAATTEALVNRVKQCPSGALDYYMNAEGNKESEHLETKVEVLENGPLLVYGMLKVTHKDGREETKNKTTAFCHCGASTNKPYYDGVHVKEAFKDKKSALKQSAGKIYRRTSAEKCKIYLLVVTSLQTLHNLIPKGCAKISWLLP